MNENEDAVAALHVANPTTTGLDPLRLLDLTADGVKFLDPIIGHVAKAIIGAAKEKRLEIEARLLTRLKELSDVFAALEAGRVSEMADRDRQFMALSVVLELAKVSGDPALMTRAMDAFTEYVRAAPSLTRDFTEALKAVDSRIELFPHDEPEK